MILDVPGRVRVLMEGKVRVEQGERKNRRYAVGVTECDRWKKEVTLTKDVK